jgi:glycosyltransferase involved in cell wall biosynthesis
MDTKLRFSIIIPAHNEADYIAPTLEHIAALSYPKDCYEVIVVENGSSDATLDIAKRYESENIRVFKNLIKGVSAARNFGIDRLDPESDWVIFLDADTILQKEFLNEMNSFLSKPNSYSVGTTSVRPYPQTANARAWHTFYDVCHRLFEALYSITIVKRSLFPALRYDETLVMAEDLHMIKQARKHGKFFFVPTKSVSTSTRRFDQEGYWNIFFQWTFVANLPKSMQRRFTYKLVR